ncbi:lytic polysaccharide monooxygenase auxiliary activity family 9 protein [Streptomyces sp. NPDC058394]|uniref:lytic polysaccharide monooxygenase auxiliary activity family 9 protein n=1 Tax=Streptomyces sp. NPDC058394 TaxID=3346477 RepID=UPI00365BBC1A
MLIDGEARQTTNLYWPAWDWTKANRHWVSLGEAPKKSYRVQIRALAGGEWLSTNEVVVETGSGRSYAPPRSPKGTRAPVPNAAPRHGTVDFPPSRAAVAIRDLAPAPICVEARRLNTSTTWQEVLPGAERMLADYPWNHELKYLEYRKFFGDDSTVASTGNGAFRGLDLAASDRIGDWPVSEIDGSAEEQTFTYDHMAYHSGESWSHQWFITKEGWDPAQGLSWDDLDPVPFLVEVHGAERQEDSASWTIRTLPRRTGRHAIVNIWGGHGGPDTPDGSNGGKSGEFFLSVSDVEIRA